MAQSTTEERLEARTDRRAPVVLSRPSYVDDVAHAARSTYIRAVIDQHLAEVREALAALRARGQSDAEIVALCEIADRPLRSVSDDEAASLAAIGRDDVSAVAAEAELMGLPVADAIRALDSGRCA